MFDPLLWVLPYFTPHYAGQTTQGDTDDGGSANQASDSKDTTSLPHRTTPTTLPTTLQESNILDQSDASLSADPQPKKVCKDGYWLQRISSPCSQQPSPSGSQPSTLHDPPQSDEMPLPALVEETEAESYSENWETDQYNAFTKDEAQYVESEYSLGDILGQGSFGVVYLATRKSDGKKVAYKSIPYTKTYKYALESSPPSRYHLLNPLVRSEEPSAAQCMSPRPLDLLVPHEFMVQKYLSRPGHESPYVPVVIDYFILENEYILVMEHLDEKWVNFASYVKEKGLLDIENARDITEKIVNGMISLKQHGILHDDLIEENIMYNTETGEIKLIDFGLVSVFPGWEEGKSVPLKLSDPPSPTVSEYKAEDRELWRIWMLGKLLYRIITPKDIKLCEQVTGHCIRSGLVPAIQKSRLRLLGRALDPGVENVYTWLRGGVLNGEADLD
ncbi:hypothetical protein BASA83_004214 [Batrachochytrium salamandrivorans]|nr:hypothetical protein BASA83_004214 [Batrachochytrium salamandrivorans]